MSVVIIGGNERMEQQYKEICKRYRCKAKVFTRMSGNLKTQIGQPDLIILFTSTVAHKMVHCALREAQRYNIPVERGSQQQRQRPGQRAEGMLLLRSGKKNPGAVGRCIRILFFCSDPWYNRESDNIRRYRL